MNAVHIDRLVELARAGQITLAITSGFEVDQRTASEERRRANLAYLSERPVAAIPGPFRFDVSTFNGPDVVIEDDVARLDEVIKKIVLSGSTTAVGAGRKIKDVHHLTAHRMAQHDIFVTDDVDDLVKKRERLLSEAGIVIRTPQEAVALVLSDADSPQANI